MTQINEARVLRVMPLKGPGTQHAYLCAVGDPCGVEVICLGNPEAGWAIMGVRGFGVSFPGDGGGGYRLTQATQHTLNELVEEQEKDENDNTR